MKYLWIFCLGCFALVVNGAPVDKKQEKKAICQFVKRNAYPTKLQQHASYLNSSNYWKFTDEKLMILCKADKINRPSGGGGGDGENSPKNDEAAKRTTTDSKSEQTTTEPTSSTPRTSGTTGTSAPTTESTTSAASSTAATPAPVLCYTTTQAPATTAAATTTVRITTRPIRWTPSGTTSPTCPPTTPRSVKRLGPGSNFKDDIDLKAEAPQRRCPGTDFDNYLRYNGNEHDIYNFDHLNFIKPRLRNMRSSIHHEYYDTDVYVLKN